MMSQPAPPQAVANAKIPPLRAFRDRRGALVVL